MKPVWDRARTMLTLEMSRLWKATSQSPIVLPERREPNSPRRNLAVAAIAWNEGRDLCEWLGFHQLVGVEHVYLYDDGSTDDTKSIVRPFIDAGFATYIPWSKFLDVAGQQRLAYAHALCTFGPEWRWMAFIDVDEFLFPVADRSLATVLPRYDDMPAIAVPWHTFGFGGHEKRPQGLIIENYTKRMDFPPKASELFKWKSIVDPACVVAVDSPHFFHLADGRRGGYNEDRVWIGKQRPDGWQECRSNVLRVNHYFTRSREDYQRRKLSGRSVSGQYTAKAARERALRYAGMIDSAESVDDTLILRYGPALREALSNLTSLKRTA